MRRVAMLSMHTSPLAQPGTGDGGGMNVYARATAPGQPASVAVEPGLTVHHLVAGPPAEVPKGRLHTLVDAFAQAVEAAMETAAECGGPAEVIHANYWLSGVAGHALKHRLGLPLVSTFHT